MFAITLLQRSRIRTYHSIVYTSFYEIQFSRYELEEPNQNRMYETFRLSCGEKIVIDIKFTTHTTMEIENMKRILNCLDI